MITITKQDNGVLFTFENSDKYLYGNGTIEVPFNSLSIVADESDMITLKKAASNDVFISARYDTDLGYRSKDDAIDDLKDLLFAETGGGGSESGITSGEVQTMIDESISGKADTSVVNQAISEATQAILSVSGDVQTKLATTDFNAYSAATDSRLAEDEEVTAAALNNLNENKQDALTAGQGIDITNNVISSTVNITVDPTLDTGSTNPVANSAITNAINAKQDALHIYTENNNLGTAELHSNDSSIIFNAGGASITANNPLGINTFNVAGTGVTINNEGVLTEGDITTAITSGSTDTEIPSAKAVYDTIQAGGGGGATYSAGTNISIANDTINCTLNLSNDTGNLSLKGGDGCTATGRESFAFGKQTIADREGSVAFGKCNISNSTGGQYFTGSHSQYLFTLGNGSNASYRHNAFEVRQSGDIYFPDTDNTTYSYDQKPMVRLQDMYAALGGLKFVQCSQSEYDSMVSGGTVDSSTIYFITNVVS